ncbi:hypothetical protein OIU76_027193 [Salix suchowensis]|nr:hypothetical protein OIU76_027193 [Salix suchowensis]
MKMGSFGNFKNTQKEQQFLNHSEISTSPSVISCCKSFGSFPSTVHPTETHVPRISFTVPLRSLAIDLELITFAISMTSSRDIFPLCFMFLVFFLSLSGSFNALIIKGRG